MTQNSLTYGGITIPGQQAQPPAGHPDIAFRPDCDQLDTVLQANKLVAYTLLLPDNTIRILDELEPMDLTRAHLWMDSAGLCKVNGVEVPIVYTSQVPRQTTARVTVSVASQPVAPAAQESGGMMPLIIGGGVLVAIAGVVIALISVNGTGKRKRAIVTPPPSADTAKATPKESEPNLIDELWGN